MVGDPHSPPSLDYQHQGDYEGGDRVGSTHAQELVKKDARQDDHRQRRGNRREEAVSSECATANPPRQVPLPVSQPGQNEHRCRGDDDTYSRLLRFCSREQSKHGLHANIQARRYKKPRDRSKRPLLKPDSMRIIEQLGAEAAHKQERGNDIDRTVKSEADQRQRPR